MSKSNEAIGGFDIGAQSYFTNQQNKLSQSRIDNDLLHNQFLENLANLKYQNIELPELAVKQQQIGINQALANNTLGIGTNNSLNIDQYKNLINQQLKETAVPIQNEKGGIDYVALNSPEGRAKIKLTNEGLKLFAADKAEASKAYNAYDNSTGIGKTVLGIGRLATGHLTAPGTDQFTKKQLADPFEDNATTFSSTAKIEDFFNSKSWQNNLEAQGIPKAEWANETKKAKTVSTRAFNLANEIVDNMKQGGYVSGLKEQLATHKSNVSNILLSSADPEGDIAKYFYGLKNTGAILSGKQAIGQQTTSAPSSAIPQQQQQQQQQQNSTSPINQENTETMSTITPEQLSQLKPYDEALYRGIPTAQVQQERTKKAIDQRIQQNYEKSEPVNQEILDKIHQRFNGKTTEQILRETGMSEGDIQENLKSYEELTGQRAPTYQSALAEKFFDSTVRKPLNFLAQNLSNGKINLTPNQIVQNFNTEHPIQSFLADLGVDVGVFSTIQGGIALNSIKSPILKNIAEVGLTSGILDVVMGADDIKKGTSGAERVKEIGMQFGEGVIGGSLFETLFQGRNIYNRLKRGGNEVVEKETENLVNQKIGREQQQANEDIERIRGEETKAREQTIKEAERDRREAQKDIGVEEKEVRKEAERDTKQVQKDMSIEEKEVRREAERKIQQISKEMAIEEQRIRKTAEKEESQARQEEGQKNKERENAEKRIKELEEERQNIKDDIYKAELKAGKTSKEAEGIAEKTIREQADTLENLRENQTNKIQRNLVTTGEANIRELIPKVRTNLKKYENAYKEGFLKENKSNLEKAIMPEEKKVIEDKLIELLEDKKIQTNHGKLTNEVLNRIANAKNYGDLYDLSKFINSKYSNEPESFFGQAGREINREILTPTLDNITAGKFGEANKNYQNALTTYDALKLDKKVQLQDKVNGKVKSKADLIDETFASELEKQLKNPLNSEIREMLIGSEGVTGFIKKEINNILKGESKIERVAEKLEDLANDFSNNINKNPTLKAQVNFIKKTADDIIEGNNISRNIIDNLKKNTDFRGVNTEKLVEDMTNKLVSTLYKNVSKDGMEIAEDVLTRSYNIGESINQNMGASLDKITQKLYGMDMQELKKAMYERSMGLEEKINKFQENQGEIAQLKSKLNQPLEAIPISQEGIPLKTKLNNINQNLQTRLDSVKSPARLEEVEKNLQEQLKNIRSSDRLEEIQADLQKQLDNIKSSSRLNEIEQNLQSKLDQITRESNLRQAEKDFSNPEFQDKLVRSIIDDITNNSAKNTLDKAYINNFSGWAMIMHPYIYITKQLFNNFKAKEIDIAQRAALNKILKAKGFNNIPPEIQNIINTPDILQSSSEYYMNTLSQALKMATIVSTDKAMRNNK